MSGKVKAYAHFDITLKNVRWSWAGCADSGRVAVGIWEDEYYNDQNPQYSCIGHPRLHLWRGRHGNRERIDILKKVWAKQDRSFHVVMMTAKDNSKEPRQTKKAEPMPFKMRLISLDQNTGEFSAERVEGDYA